MRKNLTLDHSVYFADYRPDRNDVIVCAYAKSGTNWMLQIAVQIAHRGAAEFEHIHDLVIWPDDPRRKSTTEQLFGRDPRRTPADLQVIKTHLQAQFVPYNTAARYICLARDPKDVFVSSYHFIRAVALGSKMPPITAWLEQYLTPKKEFGWAEHLSGYWKIRQRENVEFVTYEAMSADLPDVIRRVARLMGSVLSPAEFDSVLRQSRFEHMKEISYKFEPRAQQHHHSANGIMIRRGKSGGSVELLSPAQQKLIDDHARAALERLKCDFPYDQAFPTRK